MMIYFLYLKQAVAAQEQNLPIVFQNKVGQTKTKSLEFELGQDFQTVKHTWGHLPPSPCAKVLLRRFAKKNNWRLLNNSYPRLLLVFNPSPQH